MRVVYLPELRKRIKQDYPGVTVQLYKGLPIPNPQLQQAERERKRISDEELH